MKPVRLDVDSLSVKSFDPLPLWMTVPLNGKKGSGLFCSAACSGIVCQVTSGSKCK